MVLGCPKCILGKFRIFLRISKFFSFFHDSFAIFWKAFEIFKAMKQQGVVPDVITCNALISACEKGLQAERALEIFDTMEQQGPIFGRLAAHGQLQVRRVRNNVVFGTTVEGAYGNHAGPSWRQRSAYHRL